MKLPRVSPRFLRRADASLLALTLVTALVASPAAAQQDAAGRGSDPRVGLGGGFRDAKSAIKNMRLVGHGAKAQGWFNPQSLGDFGFANSDLAFQGNLVFQGGWRGWNAWDISDPAAPKIRASHVCQGGQGDPSVHGNLLFISVEDLAGRLDCGTEGVADTVSLQRFRGVRIFDISDLDHPQQVAAVQTCRGSHTHTLVTDPRDTTYVYVYVQGTGPVRSPSELTGCVTSEQDKMSSLFRIEVIRVPVAAPQNARIVNAPRVFADASGKISGLWPGGAHGAGTQETARTDQCHDITAYPAIGLAAGACSGNGILLDISNPALPKRIDQVIDKNFAYWHSATFNNMGTTVLFTDEWGGGTSPRCRDTDKMEWGADAIFTLGADRKLKFASYYKMPAPQTAAENCVAHNGGLIPVPGRDIMVQAWYQGGVSVVDFTNPAKPVEIAYFDRGPMTEQLALGGYWSSYWYNGHVYASEIGRGLDIFELVPSEFLTQNEIDAAKSVRTNRLNAQLQERIYWPSSYSVAGSYLDQLKRGNGLPAARLSAIDGQLTSAKGLARLAQVEALTKLAKEIDAEAAKAGDPTRVRLLAAAVSDLARAVAP
jgi:hypothetical protein